jgi:ubiquinone/menaquinone biosynthesis C-methylase UbiE
MQKDFIKSHWNNQANRHHHSHLASWGDNFMIDLEIATIGEHIMSGAKVLDIGCGNGFSTFRQLDEHPDIDSIFGVDYSEEMIFFAAQTKRNRGLGEKIAFEVGDIRAIGFPENSFDLVYTTRVLINLPNWEEQKSAIDECIRVTRPSGKVIFSEAFWEPLVLLNAMRTLKQLPALVEHDFNRYLKKSEIDKLLRNQGLAFCVNDFSSVYYLGSRFLRELVTDPTAYPGFSNPINRIFYEIEKEFSGGGFGIQQAYIVTK